MSLIKLSSLLFGGKTGSGGGLVESLRFKIVLKHAATIVTIMVKVSKPFYFLINTFLGAFLVKGGA